MNNIEDCDNFRMKNIQSEEEGGKIYEIQDEEVYDFNEHCSDIQEQHVEENIVISNTENDDHVSDISGSLVGVEKDTLEEMYELYRMHACSLGFSIRKSTTRFYASDNTVVLSKLFVCSCQGLRRKNESSLGAGTTLKKKDVGITRTGCKASMLVRKNKDGRFEVVRHGLQHNHQLTRSEWSHLHRSERQITAEKGKVIEDMLSSGMRSIDSYRYIAQNVGGEGSVGHTIKDHYNFVNRWKMKLVEIGDANTLIELINKQENEEDDFFYKVRVNEEGRLASIFWRDSLMKKDYEVYGDVVVFDTTYKTNKYGLICAPFVGVNNHWKNVMFGCAFISDEKIETFEWLFQTFKKGMQGKTPTTMFTDQDLAISKAIEKIFPATRHRLCLWHIQQNAVKKLGKLKKEGPFKDAFNKYLMGCADEEEFESCWRNLISTYGLENNNWLKRLYSVKEKWCTSLSKEIFSAGIRSSQRSESTNHVIGFKAKKQTNLTEFYGIFKEAIDHWRTEERVDEFNCSRIQPDSRFDMRGLLKHAAEVYTLTMFKHFENEFFKCVSATSTVDEVQDSKLVYTVTYDGLGRLRRVVYDIAQNLISCSCMKFEEFGMLCYHCLRILHIHNIKKIPSGYILKRWCKIAKEHVWDKIHIDYSKKNCNNEIMWSQKMNRIRHNIVLMSEGNEKKRKIIEEGNERDLKVIAAVDAMEHEVPHPESSNTVLDPLRSVTKGRSKRVKSSLQKNKKKANTSKSSQMNEFGSKTPNPKLF